MSSRAHDVAVPECEDSLSVLFRRVHGRYAQVVNAQRLRSGHLWQNRFYSYALSPTSNATRCERRSSNVRRSINGQAPPRTWGSPTTVIHCWIRTSGPRMAARKAGPNCWRRPRIRWTRTCSGAALMQAGHLAGTTTSRGLKSSFSRSGGNGASRKSRNSRLS